MSNTTKAKANSKKIRCAFCGKPFAPKTANALYCGGKCKAAAKNALKRVHRRLVKEKMEAALKKEPPKTACKVKVSSVQKVKLPKPPTQSRVSPEAKKAVCDAYNAQRDRFLLIGLLLSLLVKTLFESCENIKATFEHVKVAKIPVKKAK